MDTSENSAHSYTEGADVHNEQAISNIDRLIKLADELYRSMPLTESTYNLSFRDRESLYRQIKENLIAVKMWSKAERSNATQDDGLFRDLSNLNNPDA